MPRGQPGSGTNNRDFIKERIKEYEARLKQIDRRDKALGELKKWLLARKLDFTDLAAMARELKPKRADAPVKSKKPLHPEVAKARGGSRKDGKTGTRGDPEFRRAIREARMDKRLTHDQVGEMVGASGASISNWETGRYVPKEEARVAILKALSLPSHLGAEATKAMMAEIRAPRLRAGANGVVG